MTERNKFFIAVFKTYHSKQPNGKIKKLNEFLRKTLAVNEDSDVYEKLAQLLEQLLQRKPLREYGMKKAEIEIFADQVISGQQRLLVNNYVPLSRDEIRDIFQALYYIASKAVRKSRKTIVEARQAKAKLAAAAAACLYNKKT